MNTLDKLRFAVVGGDMRSIYLARLLLEDGNSVVRYASETAPADACGIPCADSLDLSACDCVVLPLPVLGDGNYINAPFSRVKLDADDLLSQTGRGTLVAGGKIPHALYSRADSLGIRMVDYLEREELAVLNAIPTAEGAIAIAMEHLSTTLHGCKCLVVGFGRIGKILAADLRALGCEVTATARKYSDIAWISASGHTAMQTSRIPQVAGDFDIIFNTVPAEVLGRNVLSVLKPNVPVIDLASKPGGVDWAAAKELGVTVVWALSLPGKVAPLTSGAIIKDTIYNIYDQWRCGDA